MKNKILSGGMVVVFTIMTVANLLATRINIAAQPAYDCHASECDPPCHDSECDYLAKIECNDFCALYNDYCLEVSLFETWCHYDTGECWHLYEIFCWNGHWEYWTCCGWDWVC